MTMGHLLLLTSANEEDQITVPETIKLNMNKMEIIKGVV